jgi:phospholipase C
MGRTASLCLSLVLVSAGVVLLSLNGCSGRSSGSTVPGQIEHVVVIFQENRTPDNLFHDPVLIKKGADIASTGVNSSHQTITLQPTSLGIDYDLSHAHAAFVDMYDGGQMDGADKVPISCSKGAINCPPANAQFMYVQASDVSPYFEMAEQYTFGDRMFQTNEGPSFPAHQFILSGTSAPTAASKLFASENPNGGAGCAAAPASTVALIDPSGSESSSTYPCFEHATLSDELDAKGVSWRYYSPSAGSIWTAPNAIKHLCGPNATPPNATACTGSDWVNNVVLDDTRILTDIVNGNLAQVSWVIPNGINSDHAGSTATTGGPSWVASIVNAIGNSSYWANTAIIVTWDDWGGWYDHVPPPKVISDGTSWGSGYVYGFRVPLIVISPYAKAGYISHVNHDFGSILNLIEKTYGLASLGYADAYADDLSDCFDLNQNPIMFTTINAQRDAAYFLNDQSPKTDPDDD